MPFAYKDYNLSGGHAINGAIGPGDYDCTGCSNLSPSMPGFCDKPEEVGLESGGKYRVSGASGKFKEYDIETDREKSPKSLKILQSNSSQSEDSHLRIDQVIRPSHFHNKNSTSSSTAVLIFTTAASLSLKKEPVIQEENKSGQNASSRFKMVDKEFKSFQWKIFVSTKNPSSESKRCLSDGMGAGEVVWVWKQKGSGLCQKKYSYFPHFA